MTLALPPIRRSKKLPPAIGAPISGGGCNAAAAASTATAAAPNSTIRKSAPRRGCGWAAYLALVVAAGAIVFVTTALISPLSAGRAERGSAAPAAAVDAAAGTAASFAHVPRDDDAQSPSPSRGGDDGNGGDEDEAGRGGRRADRQGPLAGAAGHGTAQQQTFGSEQFFGGGRCRPPRRRRRASADAPGATSRNSGRAATERNEDTSSRPSGKKKGGVVGTAGRRRRLGRMLRRGGGGRSSDSPLPLSDAGSIFSLVARADDAPAGSVRTDERVAGTRRRPCTLLHPAADVSDHRPDEATARARSSTSVSPPSSSEGGTIHGKVPIVVGNQADGGSWGYATPAPDDAAVLTRRGAGLGHDVNQDRAFVLLAPMGPGTAAGGSSSSGEKQRRGGGDFVMGIFDGHGDRGHVASHFASTELPGIVASAMTRIGVVANGGRNVPEGAEEERWIREALAEAFRRVDSTVDSAAGTSATGLSMAGCTASVTVRRNDRLYVANAGDSLTFVATYDKSTGRTSIAYTSRRDKPDLPDERSRIEAAGGEVYLPPAWVSGDSLRVLSRLTEEEEKDGVLPIGLAMSRSIGDRGLKDLGVIADPLVDVLRVDELREKGTTAGAAAGGGASTTSRVEKDNRRMVAGNASSAGRAVEVFVVAATDGLFDHVAPEETAERLAASLYRSDDAGSEPLLVACEGIIMKASKAWLDAVPFEVYRDDITLAVAKVT